MASAEGVYREPEPGTIPRLSCSPAAMSSNDFQSADSKSGLGRLSLLFCYSLRRLWFLVEAPSA